MVSMARATQTRRVEAVQLMLSQTPITVGAFEKLLKEAQSAGKPIEDLLPLGLIPKGAKVATLEQARKSFVQSPETRDTLREYFALTNQLGLSTSEERDIGNGLREYDFKGSCPVVVYGLYYNWWRFYAAAYDRPELAARVAYVHTQAAQPAAQKSAAGGESAVELALKTGSKEVREVLARHIEEEAGGQTAVTIALRSDNEDLRVLIAEALRSRRN